VSKSGIFFIAGCAIAVLIVLADGGRWLIARSRAADADAACHQEILRARPAPASAARPEAEPWTRYAQPSVPQPHSGSVLQDHEVFPTILSCEASEIAAYRKNQFNRFDDLVPKSLSDGPNSSLYSAQTEVMSSHQEVGRGLSGDNLVSAAMVFLIGLVPLAWYFFLRRLSELASAIRGDR